MWCPQCSQQLTPGVQFCSSCGRPVAASAPAPPAPPEAGMLAEIFLPFQSAAIVKSPVFLFLCFFSLTPLALLVFDNYSLILQALALWTALLWALLIFRFFGDRDLPLSWALGILLCTAFIGLPALELFLDSTPKILQPLKASKSMLDRWFAYTLGTGVREEMFKALPLIVLVCASQRARKPIHGLVLGMMSGIGFAVIENRDYVLNSINTSIEQMAHGIAQYVQSHPRGTITGAVAANQELFFIPLITHVMRTMACPFGHSSYAGIFGYFIARAAADKRARAPLFLAGLSVSSILHGTYDTLASTGHTIGGTLITAAAFYLVVTYVMKCRGMSSAHGLAAGMFQRTVMGRFSGPAPSAPGAPAPSVVAAQVATPSVAAQGPAPQVVSAQFIGAPGSGGGAPGTQAPLSGGWQLRCISGAVSGRSFRLFHGMVIGRDPAHSGLCLEEPSVSRQHAVLEIDSAGCSIRRLSQTGELFVNNRPAQHEALRPGDQVRIGSTVLLVEQV